MLVLVCVVPILVALALIATAPKSGGLLDASALSLTLRGSRYLKIRGHLIPGVHVAASWPEWVAHWAGQRPSAPSPRVEVQTFEVNGTRVVERSISVTSRAGLQQERK